MSSSSSSTVVPVTGGAAVRKGGDALSPEIAQSIAAAIAGLEFGSVEITIHNGRVVQIERHERIRFGSAPETRKG